MNDVQDVASDIGSIRYHGSQDICGDRPDRGGSVKPTGWDDRDAIRHATARPGMGG